MTEDTNAGQPEDWVIQNCEYLQWIGLEVERQTAGEVELSLPFHEKLTTPGRGALHGGIVATVIDNAAGGALRTVLESPTETGHATTDLNVSYLRPVTDDLRVTGRLVRRGSSMAVAKVDVESTDPDGRRKLVATGRVTLYLSRPNGD